ncbi:polyphenol oxidase family protein [Arthrobacter russicus]|uniref:YfiH family protein n=1 Tax=Arthrobacter russicus TaxID=172040 RepID=A0ABU1JF85_9MICC|nr:polyphenol oxidase family protein [Arthrobacter russicus]MDR6271099.1 YfiH family protein [Arthrobacter russicus]
MFFWRREVRPGWSVAFTDVAAGSMSTSVPADSTAAAHRAAVGGALRLASGFQFMNQVHGSTVAVLEKAGAQPEADALVSETLPLAVLVADCVPVLLLSETDDGAGMAAAVHAGRKGLAANIVAEAVAELRSQADSDRPGGNRIAAWVGPAICGKCYEVPEAMRAEIAAGNPASYAETSWGTPSIDLRAGVGSQLAALGVEVNHIEVCTREEPRLFSHRRAVARPGIEPIGRFAGLVYRTGAGEP